MGLRKKSEKDNPQTRTRRELENDILNKHGADTPFTTWTRFARRVVSKPDGYIRESGFPKNKVYWIVEARENKCSNCGHEKVVKKNGNINE